VCEGGAKRNSRIKWQEIGHGTICKKVEESQQETVNVRRLKVGKSRKRRGFSISGSIWFNLYEEGR